MVWEACSPLTDYSTRVMVMDIIMDWVDCSAQDMGTVCSGKNSAKAARRTKTARREPPLLFTTDHLKNNFNPPVGNIYS